jgi:hypothetical protein
MTRIVTALFEASEAAERAGRDLAVQLPRIAFMSERQSAAGRCL